MAERYYWIICKDPDTNKPYLIAGGDTEMSARQKGLESLSGIDFEVRELPTRDLSRASSMIRGKRLEDTRSLRAAKERLGHDRSLKRAVRKRQRRMARDVY
jgi:hypothetical protein